VASLTDLIERHIKEMLAMQNKVELRRRDLADLFACVPSQINYVLATRFTPERGYIVETRRGGAGYVRIERIRWTRPDFLNIVYDQGIRTLTEEQAQHLLIRLQEAGILSSRHVRLIRQAMERELEGLPRAWQDRGRALFLKGSLLTALLED